jgi:hypothetical protein
MPNTTDGPDDGVVVDEQDATSSSTPIAGTHRPL